MLAVMRRSAPGTRRPRVARKPGPLPASALPHATAMSNDEHDARDPADDRSDEQRTAKPGIPVRQPGPPPLRLERRRHAVEGNREQAHEADDHANGCSGHEHPAFRGGGVVRLKAHPNESIPWRCG